MSTPIDPKVPTKPELDIIVDAERRRVRLEVSRPLELEPFKFEVPFETVKAMMQAVLTVELAAAQANGKEVRP